MMKTLVAVDCQHDFIDGTLACKYGLEAVSHIVDFINTIEVEPLYSSDYHKETNKSFIENGGIWPVHCVAGSHGAQLAAGFRREIKDLKKRPNQDNIFYKGMADEPEEYSAFSAVNQVGEKLADKVSKEVYVAGIASEYCVRETVLALLAAEHQVTLLEKGLAWVDDEGHRKNITDLKKRGVNII